LAGEGAVAVYRIVLANVVRILIAVVVTASVGFPLLAVIYSTYGFGLLCSWLGRQSILNRILEWNAHLAGVIAQRCWARPLLKVCGVNVETFESVPVDWSRAHVVCSNHASIFDILALAAVVPPTYRFVAKRELLRWPVIGWTLYPGGQIVINRSDHTGAVRRIAEAGVRDIRGQVIFFVEGTRTRTGQLLPFKKGAFHFAIDHQIPILPTAIAGSYNVLAKVPWWRLQPGREIDITFCAPINPPPLSASDDDGAQREAMQGLLERSREAIADVLSSSS
jgi:1-acyl-sn-glycerol-3-phosphate acyltransferase